MNKKTWLIIGISAAVVIVAACVVVAIAQENSKTSASESVNNESSALRAMSIEQARALSVDEACLVNDPGVKAKAQSVSGLSEDSGVWTGEIYDVPAGTNVDVSVATYNGTDTVTGSLAYGDQYGSYNVTLNKQSDGWRYTQFVGCHSN